MELVDSVVVGIEPSAAGEAALDWALREAASARVPLVAVRAYVPFPLEPVYGEPGAVPPVRAHAQETAEAQLAAARTRVPDAALVDVHAEAAIGPTARVLSERSGPGTLVVVGNRGARALSRTVLGSVTSSVLHHATGQVAVVPKPAPASDDPPRVVVGVDHSACSLRALEVAVEHARRLGLPLHPVHVHEQCAAPTGESLPVLEACDADALLEEAEKAGASDLSVDVAVVTGHAADTLVQLARPQDLLVLGSRGRGGFPSLLLGSTSTQCSQHAACPVLVVRGS